MNYIWSICKLIETLIALESPVFDLLTYSVKLLVDHMHFNIKCKLELMDKTEWY